MLKGQVTIQIKEWNKEGTLETINEIKQDNKICINVYNLLQSFSLVFPNTTTHRIYLSNLTTTENFNTTTSGANTILATGDITALASPYVFTQRITGDALNPSDLFYNQRFNAPSSNRTINSLGITSNAPLINTLTSSNYSIHTYLKLSTPIIQTTAQVLDVSYRLYIDWSDPTLVNAPPRYLYALEQAFFGQSTTSSSNTFRSYKFLTAQTKNNTDFIYVENNQNQNPPASSAALSPGLNVRSTLLALDLKSSFLGRFVSSIIIGSFTELNNGLPSFIHRNNFQKTTNLGGVTSHNNVSTLMTYDASNLANASWRPNINDGPTPDFPSLYLLKITQSGGLGVGRYKIYKTGYGGYLQGKWNRGLADAFVHLDLSYLENYNSTIKDSYSFYNYRWIYPWASSLGEETFVSYQRSYGVGLYKVTDRGMFLLNSWKLTDYPALAAAYIFDIVTVPATNLIYVATSIGLFTIHAITNVVTQLSPDKCLALAKGFNDAVFGVFNPSGTTGRISSSIGTNWGTAYPVGTQTPTVNWANVWRIFIDPDSNNYEMMFIEGDTPKGTVRLINPLTTFGLYRRWWNLNSGFLSTTNTGWSTSSGDFFLTGDLICYGLTNSVLVTKGIWIYLNSPEPYSRHFDGRSTGISKDLIQDCIKLNTLYFSNIPLSYFTNIPSISLGNTAGIDLNNTNLSNYRFLFYGKMAISQFNANPLIEFFAAANSCASFIKPKLNTEGNIFSIVFTMGDYYSNDLRPYSHAIRDNASTTDFTTVPKLPTFNRTSTYSIVQRMGGFYKANINLTGTPSASILDYGDLGDAPLYSLWTQHSSLIGNIQVTPDKRMIIHDRQTNYACGSLRMFSPLRAPVTDTTDLTMQTWEWDGTNWVDDPLNIGLGKPLHTTTDNLVDGLSINWTDLQAGNSKNLIQDQYYVFTRTTAPNTVPIEAHTPAINISNYLSMRPRVDSNTTFTNLNSANSIYVKENPLGTSPDTNFYAVNSAAFFTDTLTSNDLLLTGTLNGIPVIINSTLLATTPSAGQINVTKGGRVLVNSVDNGKTLLLNYSYSRKVDSSEIAVTP